MDTYEFTVVLTGSGESEAEAWNDAVDSFSQDAGEPATTTKLTTEGEG